jgi:hypothetical protein
MRERLGARRWSAVADSAVAGGPRAHGLHDVQTGTQRKRGGAIGRKDARQVVIRRKLTWYVPNGIRTRVLALKGCVTRRRESAQDGPNSTGAGVSVPASVSFSIIVSHPLTIPGAHKNAHIRAQPRGVWTNRRVLFL